MAAMKVAAPAWRGRIAPVFDVARSALVFDAEEAEAVGAHLALPGGSPWAKVECLKAQGVGTLICGAISRPLQEHAEMLGIQVQSFVAGPVDEVVQAWRNNGLNQSRYSMPGCRRCRRRRGKCKPNRTIH